MSTIQRLLLERIAALSDTPVAEVERRFVAGLKDSDFAKKRIAHEVKDFFDSTGVHVYLSTSCLHGVHNHCDAKTAITGGPKIATTCKWCVATCVCECHEGGNEALVPA